MAYYLFELPYIGRIQFTIINAGSIDRITATYLYKEKAPTQLLCGADVS
jgi:hypothetical protein